MPYRELTSYQAVISQARAYRSLRAFMAHVLDRYGLTMTQWLMLGTVIDGGKQGVRVSELAHSLGVELPVVTNLVNKAEQAGQIVRVVDPEDKRSRRVVATMEFAERACDIEGEIQAATTTWLKGIDAASMRHYLNVVNAMSRSEQ